MRNSNNLTGQRGTLDWFNQAVKDMSMGLQLTKLNKGNKNGGGIRLKHDKPLQGKERKAETCSGITDVIACYNLR